MKKLSVRQMASVKKTAQIVSPLVLKKSKLQARIQSLNEEIAEVEEAIRGFEGGIIALTGHMSEDLVRRVVEPTDKTDKDGNVIKVTKYVPTSIVTFNEEERCYYIEDKVIPAATVPEKNENSDEDTDDLKELSDFFNQAVPESKSYTGNSELLETINY